MKHLTSLFALALLAGCGASDNDGDGRDQTRDCDDDNVNVYPGAMEFCDGLDNDCNGVIDDGHAVDAVVFFLDNDGDGYGTAESGSATACADVGLEGYVADASDCDDDDPDVYPTAPELCNRVDDNCNGAVDDDPEDAPTWYADFDEDGFGSRTLLRRQCEGPAGWIKVGGDCNDFDRFVSPDALEFCDRIDNDCDGVVDEPDAEDHRVFYRDDDGDGHGNADRPIDACYLPDGYAELDDDCNDDPAASGGLQTPGTEEICRDGLDNNCDGDGNQCWYTDWTTVDKAVLKVEGPNNSAYLGYAVENAGDVNGDGYDDLTMGAYRSSASSFYGGAGYLLYGAADGTWTEREIASEDLPHWGLDSSYDYLGRHVSGVGDIDRDGYSDFAMGAYAYDGSRGFSSGGVVLVYGKRSDFDAELVNAETDGGVIFEGPGSSIYLGATIAPAGDVNSDGFSDVLMGGYLYRHDGNYGAGSIWVVPGSGNRYEDIVDISAFGQLVGKEAYDYVGGFGGSVDSGDVDGDGRVDLFVGAYGANGYTGAVYGLYGTGSGYTGVNVLEDMHSIKYAGDATFDYMGYSATVPGDLNGDGYDDLVIGHYRGNGNAGVCYIMLGDSAQLSSGRASSRADVTIEGSGASAYLCRDRGAFTDIDNDGDMEMAVGAYRMTTGGGTYNGAAYIYSLDEEFWAQDTWSDSDADVEMRGPDQQYAYYGIYLTAADVNGDDYGDVVVGSYGADSYAGASYIYLGTDW